MTDELSLKPHDVLTERIETLRDEFPEVFTEGKIDFEKLREVLGDEVVTGRERYGLSWAGKSEAARNIQTPSVATLVPDRGESVEFDSTENLFIEGDNLEVLKLLQKSYHGRVKMIYIDPPYNTGNEFIYPDNFREGIEDYLRFSGQVNDEGLRVSTNTETGGRYHSTWLSMMYPRLFLARNLLRDDGVIFVSIDDHEVHNLQHLMDEVFGEENFLGTIVWKGATDNNPTHIAMEHEYFLVFAKNRTNLPTAWKNSSTDSKSSMLAEYERLKSVYMDDLSQIQMKFRRFVKANRESLSPLTHYDRVDERGPYTGSRKVDNPKPGGYQYNVVHPETGEVCTPPANGYRYPKERMVELIQEERILFPEQEDQIVQIKEYLEDYEGKLASVIHLDSRTGSNELNSLFGERKVFNNPKPAALIRDFFDFCIDDNDLVLDFFAGSATTAQAVLALNREDGGNRKFIMVQLPEPTGNLNYATIADIGKERIRRVIEKLNEDDEGKLLTSDRPFEDRGLKVFKLTSSNFDAWDGTLTEVPTDNGTALEDQLLDAVENVKEDRGPEDMFYEVLLRAGWPLTTEVKVLEVANGEVFSAASENGTMFVCLEDPVTGELLREMMNLETSPSGLSRCGLPRQRPTQDQHGA